MVHFEQIVKLQRYTMSAASLNAIHTWTETS